MGSKIVFFSFSPKGTYVKANLVRKTYVIQLVKGYQNNHYMILHDLPFVKTWGSKNSFSQILGILRV
jgi:hypothetical protein